MTAIRAVLTGSLVCLAGTILWSGLLGLNLKFGSSIPWAVPMAAILLWLYWRYLGGHGWPRAGAETRRSRLRAHKLSGSLWAWALAAGVLAVASAVDLQLVYARFVRVPFVPWPDISQYPFLTLLCVLLMSAVVAGFMEEAGFRGYMQVPLEIRYGPVAASAIVAIVFGFSHFSHGVSNTLPRLPYYFAISIIYSSIAYLANSILPTVTIHVCGDVLEFLYVWLHGMPHPKPLLWQAPPDREFWMHLGFGLFFGLLAIGAYRKLAAVSRAELRLVNVQPDVIHRLHGGASLVFLNQRQLISAFLHQTLLLRPIHSNLSGLETRHFSKGRKAFRR